jgi:deoxyadenosine/deoxycytidine kinase
MSSINMSSPILVSLEGNIGAGKSTILEKLAERMEPSASIEEGLLQKHRPWIFLREPVHIWNTICDSSGQTILSKFYADPTKYAFAFQIMAYTTRLHELRRLLRENPDCRGIICERSLDADKHIFAKMLHDNGTMDDVMYQIYDRYFAEYDADYKTNAVIYVDADADVCYHRIKERSREGEEGIPLDYLEKCREYHETWLRRNKDQDQDYASNTKISQTETPSNILHLKTNAQATFDPTDMDDIGNKWLNQIGDFLDTLLAAKK